MLIPFYDVISLNAKISGIIHIGAHELEELPSYLKKKIKHIIWVEANPAKYKSIEEKIKNFDDMFLGKFAAGSYEEKVELNIANNGLSSSILDFGTHKENYPEIKYTSKVSVKKMPVDKWIENNIINKEKYNFLVIDIQGYELEALKGMTEQLNFIDFIYSEVNFQDVYKGCAQIDDIDRFLSKFNFYRVGTYKTKHGWGDAIYTKRFIFFNRIYYNLYLKIIFFIRKFVRILRKILLFRKLKSNN